MATDPNRRAGGAEVDRLVAAAREGDRAAFDELVRRTYVDTYTLAMRLTANEEDARDVVQEAYLRAWKGIGRFRGDAQFSTWMYRITANAAATLRAASAAASATESARRRGRAGRHRASSAQPEAAAESASSSMDRALGARSTSCRRSCGALVVLKDVYGLSHEAIAEELGISVAAAKVRLHRGREALRDLLYEEGGRPRPCGVTRSRVLLPEAGRRRTPVDPAGAAPRRVVPALPGRARPLPPDAARRSSCCGPSTSSPRPACSPQTLAAHHEAGERRAVRSLLVGPPPRVRRRDRRRRGSPPRRTAAALILARLPPPRPCGSPARPRPGVDAASEGRCYLLGRSGPPPAPGGQ